MTTDDDAARIDAIVTDGKARIESARSDWRLGQIREAAKILIGEKGCNRMTMQELAKVAGVSAGLVYQYVDSKEEVFMLVIKEIIDSYSSEVPEAAAGHDDPVEALAAAFGAYTSVVDRYRRQATTGYQEYKDLSAKSREQVQKWERETTAILGDLVRRCVDAGAFIEVDPDLVGIDLAFLAHMWALKHWQLTPGTTLQEFVDHQFALVLGSCLKGDRRRRYDRLLAPMRHPGTTGGG